MAEDKEHTKTHNYILANQEALKTKFTKRLINITTFSIACLTAISYIWDDEFLYAFLFVLAIAIVSIFIIYFKSRFYSFAVNILFFFISATQYYVVFNMREDINFMEAIWLLLITLFAFFALGVKWGVFYLSLTAIIYVHYFNFSFLTEEDYIAVLEKNSLQENSFEYIIALGLLSYVMYHYERFNNNAIGLYQKSIQNLEIERNNVKEEDKEKSILLQEVHYRVKNNLQIVVSLLRMQTNNLQSESAKESFNDAIQRIVTMSLVHENIFNAEALHTIDPAPYISQLTKNIFKASSTKNIQLKMDITLAHINPQKLIPLGLILNELITNSLKYAFLEKEDGEIGIQIAPKGDKEFQLLYNDNGKWIEQNKNSIGTDLIEIFTNQLDGEMKREIKEEGTFYQFTLKYK